MDKKVVNLLENGKVVGYITFTGTPRNMEFWGPHIESGELELGGNCYGYSTNDNGNIEIDYEGPASPGSSKFCSQGNCGTLSCQYCPYRTRGKLQTLVIPKVAEFEDAF